MAESAACGLRGGLQPARQACRRFPEIAARSDVDRDNLATAARRINDQVGTTTIPIPPELIDRSAGSETLASREGMMRGVMFAGLDRPLPPACSRNRDYRRVHSEHWKIVPGSPVRVPIGPTMRA